MIFYLTGAVAVGGVLLYSFLRDSSTPKFHRLSWLTLIVATVFWPIVLPAMLYKKLGHSEVVLSETRF
jgi:hypothetical protein